MLSEEYSIKKTRFRGEKKIFVWAAISYEGPRCLYFIEGKEDTGLYQQILDDCLPDIKELWTEGYIFQQDNATPHSALARKGYFNNNNIKIIDWPPQSPDLSPIENIWGIIKNKLFDRASEITSGD